MSGGGKRGPGRSPGSAGPDAFQGTPEDVVADVFLATPETVVADTAAFVAAASLLFGGHGWVGETAHRMCVNEATIWRWVNVSTAPPGPALAAMTGWVRLHALGQPVPTAPAKVG